MMDISEIMRMSPVIPVLTVEAVEVAAPLALTLAGAGLPVLELTLRTPAALDVLSLMAQAAPDAVVGAGTVLDPDTLKRAVDAGARFIVSPGLTERLARAAEQAGVPLLPGVATATDIMRGLDLGLTRFKFFPAESSGGAAAVRAFAGPFAKVVFCPTGGLTQENAAQYLQMPNVSCVGGGWIAPQALVRSCDWTGIARLAGAAADLRPSPI